MAFLKQSISYLIIILVIVCIYKDVTTPLYDYAENDTNKSINPPQIMNQNKEYEIIAHKIKSGDTVLTVTKRLNHWNTNQIDINKLIEDFLTLNPNTDIYSLMPNNTYYFPKYIMTEG